MDALVGDCCVQIEICASLDARTRSGYNTVSICICFALDVLISSVFFSMSSVYITCAFCRIIPRMFWRCMYKEPTFDTHFTECEDKVLCTDDYCSRHFHCLAGNVHVRIKDLPASILGGGNKATQPILNTAHLLMGKSLYQHHTQTEENSQMR